MFKKEFFYPNKFTIHDYKLILENSLSYCKFALIKCTNGDCHDNPLLKKISPHLCQSYVTKTSEHTTEHQYLYNLSKSLISEIADYSKDIYKWSIQGKPEDLCFLGEDKAYWFLSVVHEDDFVLFLDAKNTKSEIFKGQICLSKYIRLIPDNEKDYLRLLKTIRTKSLYEYFKTEVKIFTKFWGETEKSIISGKPISDLSGLANIKILEEYWKNHNAGCFEDDFDYFVDDIEDAKKMELDRSIQKIFQMILSSKIKNKETFINYVNGLIERLKKNNLNTAKLLDKYPSWDQELININIQANIEKINNLNLWI